MITNSDGKEIKTMTSREIPVEIFVLFLTNNLKEFTVTDLQREFDARYKIFLQEKRINQILTDFVESGKISFHIKKNGRNKDTRYYKFLKLA